MAKRKSKPMAERTATEEQQDLSQIPPPENPCRTTESGVRLLRAGKYYDVPVNISASFEPSTMKLAEVHKSEVVPGTYICRFEYNAKGWNEDGTPKG